MGSINITCSLTTRSQTILRLYNLKPACYQTYICFLYLSITSEFCLPEYALSHKSQLQITHLAHTLDIMPQCLLATSYWVATVYHELLGQIRNVGRIRCSVINEPDWERHETAESRFSQ